MEAKEQLGLFKKELDRELEDYLNGQVHKASKYSSEAKELLEQVKDLTLRGGKRIRAALLYYSYLAHGGRDKKEALKASMAVELSETYLLIHDDIMDDGELRRGGPTIHMVYDRLCQEKYREKTDSHRLGIGIAINAGDLACAFSNSIIAQSAFKTKDVARALLILNEVYNLESYGQCMDMISGLKETVSQEETILIHQLKTVPYTFDGPVKIGAILAGASDSQIEALGQYTVSLGTAFQIQDDILGMFGSEEKVGKPVTSDLKEGKKTLLILYALEKANKAQKEIILSNLGNKRATYHSLLEVRKVIEDTGSLEHSKQLAQKLVAKSIEALNKMKLKKEGKDFLLGIAEYMVKREY